MQLQLVARLKQISGSFGVIHWKAIERLTVRKLGNLNADVDEVELVLKEEKKTISHLLKQLKKEGRHCKVDRFFEPLNE